MSRILPISLPGLRFWGHEARYEAAPLDLGDRFVPGFSILEGMMSKEAWAKFSKAILLIAGALGIGLDPQDLDKIAAGVGALFSVIYALEGYWKKAKG